MHLFVAAPRPLRSLLRMHFGNTKQAKTTSRLASHLASRLLRVKNSSGFVLLRVSSLLLDDFNLEFFQGDILTRTNLIVKLGLLQFDLSFLI